MNDLQPMTSAEFLTLCTDLTLTCVQIPQRSDGANFWGDSDNPKAPASQRPSHWNCTLTRGDHALTFEFSKGAGHRRWKKNLMGCVYHLGGVRAFPGEPIKPGERVPFAMGRHARTIARYIEEGSEPIPPSLEDVLGSFASDMSITQDRTFEEYAVEIGMDPDSRSAEASYHQTKRHEVILRRMLAEFWEQFLMIQD